MDEVLGKQVELLTNVLLETRVRLRRALATMSDVNQWLGKHDGHVEAVKLGQAMRDVRWVLVGLEGGQDDE